MWSQWPWVSSTLPTLSRRHSSSRRSCSLAASSRTASPVSRHRTTKTLLATGPDHHLGDLHLGVLVVERGGAHGVEYGPCASIRRPARTSCGRGCGPSSPRRRRWPRCGGSWRPTAGFDPDVWRAMVDLGFVGPDLSFRGAGGGAGGGGRGPAVRAPPGHGRGRRRLGRRPARRRLAVVALAVAEDAGVWDEAGVALPATVDGPIVAARRPQELRARRARRRHSRGGGAVGRPGLGLLPRRRGRPGARPAPPCPRSTGPASWPA